MKVSYGSEEQDCPSYLTGVKLIIRWGGLLSTGEEKLLEDRQPNSCIHGLQIHGFSLLRKLSIETMPGVLLFFDLLDISFETFWPCGVGASRTRFAHVSAKPDQSEKHVARTLLIGVPP